MLAKYGSAGVLHKVPGPTHSSILKYQEILSPSRPQTILEEAQRSTRFNQIIKDRSIDRNPRIEEYLGSAAKHGDELPRKRSINKLLNACNSEKNGVTDRKRKPSEERPSTAAGGQLSRASDNRSEAARPLSSLGFGVRFAPKPKYQRDQAIPGDSNNIYKEQPRPGSAAQERSPIQPPRTYQQSASTGSNWMSRAEPIAYQRSLYGEGGTLVSRQRPITSLAFPKNENNEQGSQNVVREINSPSLNLRRSVKSPSEKAPTIEELNSKYDNIANVVVRLEKAMNALQQNMGSTKKSNVEAVSVDDNGSFLPEPAHAEKDTLSVQHEPRGGWSKPPGSKKSVDRLSQSRNSGIKKGSSNSTRKPFFTNTQPRFEEDRHSKAESSPISKTSVQDIRIEDLTEEELRELRAKIDSKLIKKASPINGYKIQESSEEINQTSKASSEAGVKFRQIVDKGQMSKTVGTGTVMTKMGSPVFTR